MQPAPCNTMQSAPCNTMLPAPCNTMQPAPCNTMHNAPCNTMQPAPCNTMQPPPCNTRTHALIHALMHACTQPCMRTCPYLLEHDFMSFVNHGFVQSIVTSGISSSRAAVTSSHMVHHDLDRVTLNAMPFSNKNMDTAIYVGAHS
eukprot:365505-Chlamydomonas_euryale.AAC.1